MSEQMNKMKKQSIAKSVKNLLTHYPSLRNNDTLLIYFVIMDNYIEKVVISVSMFSDLCFSDVMMNWSSWGLPSIETIIRTKRKIQHKYPELRATEEPLQDC